MKTNNYTFIALITLTAFFVQISVYASNNIKEVFGNQNFKIEETREIININIDKNPWESFTFAIDNIEVMNNPIVNLQVLTENNISLRADLTDGVFMSSTIAIVQTEVAASPSYTTLSFDFTEMIHDIDLSEHVYIVFYVNPGEKYNGEISIKNFKLTTEPENQPATSAALNGFTMFPSPATSFTNVEIPNAWFNSLVIMDMSGKEVAAFDVAMYAGTTYRVELQNLPKGFYTVQLIDGNTRLSEKLVIN